MTPSTRLPVAVIGATGQQGRSVIDALSEREVPIRALVRDPDSSAVRELRARGIEVVQADQEDERSITEALDGVSALFFMTTFEGADGSEGERRRGIAVAEAAARSGVPSVVYSSVGGAERSTGIPHFESKFAVEERLRALVSTTILRPTFFMENLTPQLTPDDSGEIVIRLPLPGDVPVQMIAVRDVGRAAARLLLDPEAIDGDAIEVAGDEVTLDLVAAQAADALAAPARFETIPLEYLGDDEDLKAMFRWFVESPAYQADLAETRTLLTDAQDLRAWLDAHRRVQSDEDGAQR